MCSSLRFSVRLLARLVPSISLEHAGLLIATLFCSWTRSEHVGPTLHSFTFHFSVAV